ncbi:hypothetical protein ABIA32_002683 [Streptacidiphilus sp. MAP12-20]
MPLLIACGTRFRVGGHTAWSRHGRIGNTFGLYAEPVLSASSAPSRFHSVHVICPDCTWSSSYCRPDGVADQDPRSRHDRSTNEGCPPVFAPWLNATWNRIFGQEGITELVPSGVLTCSTYADWPDTVDDPAMKYASTACGDQV